MRRRRTISFGVPKLDKKETPGRCPESSRKEGVSTFTSRSPVFCRLCPRRGNFCSLRWESRRFRPGQMVGAAAAADHFPALRGCFLRDGAYLIVSLYAAETLPALSL